MTGRLLEENLNRNISGSSRVEASIPRHSGSARRLAHCSYLLRSAYPDVSTAHTQVKASVPGRTCGRRYSNHYSLDRASRLAKR